MQAETPQKCPRCVVSRQSYNGVKYCDRHHPQRICPECGRNAGRFLNAGAWCKECREKFIKEHQLPLVFAD